MLIFIMRIKWLYSEYFWYWVTALLAGGFQFFFITFWPNRLVAGLMGFFFIGGSWIVNFFMLYYLFTFAGKLMKAPEEKEYIYD